jgi:hypothetical protein
MIAIRSSNFTDQDLPMNKGNDDSANLAADRLEGTGVYDLVMIQPPGLPFQRRVGGKRYRARAC